MSDIESNLNEASAALLSLQADGSAAADALGAAFEAVGGQIEQALGRAAITGELDFRRMAESVLADLARIAAQALIAQSGLGAGSVGQNVTLNLAVGAGADAGSVIGARGAIAGAVAAAAARGGRFQ